MLEIKGKVSTALCFAKVIEDEAVEQIRRMCDYEFTAGSRIRIMPDVHAGKGCTIGTTMTVTDKAVPNIVGVDIGCGMYTVNLGRIGIDMERMDEAARCIPSGMAVWEGRQERFDLTGLRCYRGLKDTKRLERSLGTLGGERARRCFPRRGGSPNAICCIHLRHEGHPAVKDQLTFK